MTCLAALSTRCKTRIQYCAHKETLRTTCHAVSSTHSHTHTSFIRTYNTTRTHTTLHTQTHTIWHTHTYTILHTHQKKPIIRHVTLCRRLTRTHTLLGHTRTILHTHTKILINDMSHCVVGSLYHKEEKKMIHMQYYTKKKKQTHHTIFHTVSSIHSRTHTSVTHTYNIWNKRIPLTRHVTLRCRRTVWQRNWKKGHTCNIIHTKKRYSSYDTSHYVIDTHAHTHAACAHTYNTIHTNADTHHTTCHTVLSTH